MPRRVRRRIRGNFNHRCFKPCKVPGNLLETIILSHEELEAIRLADEEKLYQEECANEMEVSRATFGRILNSARAKIADALLNGKKIIIEGE